jgi:hypothetical protein
LKLDQRGLRWLQACLICPSPPGKTTPIRQGCGTKVNTGMVTPVDLVTDLHHLWLRAPADRVAFALLKRHPGNCSDKMSFFSFDKRTVPPRHHGGNLGSFLKTTTTRLFASRIIEMTWAPSSTHFRFCVTCSSQKLHRHVPP